MSERDYRLFLNDILESIEKIEEYTSDLNFEDSFSSLLKMKNKAVDDLEKAKEIYQQLNDAKAIFETTLLEGDINLEQNWGTYASKDFEEAFKIAQKENNKQWMGIAKFKTAQSFHSTYSPVDYHRALQAYQEALSIYPEIAFDINLKIADRLSFRHDFLFFVI